MDEEFFYPAELSDSELSPEEILENKVSEFLSDYFDDILDILFYIEKTWCDKPEFLEFAKNTSEKLLRFLIDSIFYEKHQEKISITKYKKLQDFIEEYWTEINSSYNVIYNFSNQFDNPVFPNDWILFCYKESFLP
jgi:hypothetical protein